MRAGDDSEVDVLEVQASGDDADASSCRSSSSHVGRAARVGYLDVQELGLATWQLGHQASPVEPGRHLAHRPRSALGGDYARLRTDCRLDRPGRHRRPAAVYFGEGDQTLDFRTFQDHAAPDTTQHLLFKGAVGGTVPRRSTPGSSRSASEARGTNAFQTNRNIKLSDDAWAESVPNLEIENNDVRCSHASAVGPVDEDQRFYLESRGRAADGGRAADRRRVLRRGARAGCPCPALALRCRGRPSPPSSTGRDG